MTTNRKYTIFISSTYLDLVDERQEIVRACLEMGHIPIGMEMFSAANETQWDVIRRTIDTSDYYVLILAERYGSTVEAEGGIGYTEKEYDYAVSKGVPVLGFVLDNSAEWAGTKREGVEANISRLRAFKDKVRSRMASHWKNKDDLQGKFAIAIGKAFGQYPRPGWVPSTQVASPEMANELARLSTENDRLRKELERIGDPAAELAKQDQAIEEIAQIKARFKGGASTLLDVFRGIAPYLMTAEKMEYAASFAAEGLVYEMEAIANDARGLAALGLLTTAERFPHDPLMDRYSLSLFGRSIFERWEREALRKTKLVNETLAATKPGA